MGKTTDSTKLESSSFRSLIRTWLNYCDNVNGLSPKTLEGYSSNIYKFYWWWSDYTHYAESVGEHPRNVTTKHIQEFIIYLRQPLESRWGEKVIPNKEYLSPASVSFYLRSTKVFFNWLEENSQIDTNPFTKAIKVGARGKTNNTVKTVSEDDLAKLLAFLSEPEKLKTFLGKRDLAIIVMLLDSGIRTGELLSIKLCDLNLKTNRATVNGKTGKRVAIFSDYCSSVLDKYVDSLEQFNLSKLDLIWRTIDGDELQKYGLLSLIARIVKGSGVKFHAHKLRHTFASMMADEGFSSFELRDLLGHSSITTTEIYVRQSSEKLASRYKTKSPLTVLKSKEIVPKQIKKKRGRPVNNNK